MDDITLTLERHTQEIKSLKADIADLRNVHAEIRSMNETLIVLATELKHTNEHLEKHERRLEVIESQPKNRLNQIITAIISALAGGTISAIIAIVINNQ